MNALKTIIFVIVLLGVGYLLLPYVKLNPKPSENQDQSNQNNNSSNINTFKSDDFGAEFTYNRDQDGDGNADTDAKQNGDKIYVYYTAGPAEQGQWVQKFSKDPNEPLADAIKKQFLANVSEQDCFVKDMNEFYTQYGVTAPAAPDNVERALIAYPFPTDTTQPFNQNADKCPETYSLSNGLSYFQMDKSHPEKYYFFSIGQYALFADKEGQKTWQDTFQVTK